MKLPCVLMRGGTSKAVFLREEDLPSDPKQRDSAILRIFGSPDKRQIDGLGGADKLTSKVAILSRSREENADVRYLFGQVGIVAPEIDYRLNCGNISSAVGPFSIEEGLVPAREGTTTVRIFNVNTGKIIVAEVPVREGRPVYAGDFSIAGVPGTAAKITLDFAASTGAATGRLLPTGQPVDVLSVPGVGKVEASIVDIANPVAFVHAERLGLHGTEGPTEIDDNAPLVQTINEIRGQVADLIGMGEHWRKQKVPSMPACVLVQRPGNYPHFGTGEMVAAESMDLCCRQYSSGMTAKALGGTITICTGVAARIPGSVVQRVLREEALSRDDLYLGHPSGIIPVETRVDWSSSTPQVERARIWRTARRIMEGSVYIQ